MAAFKDKKNGTWYRDGSDIDAEKRELEKMGAVTHTHVYRHAQHKSEAFLEYSFHGTPNSTY